MAYRPYPNSVPEFRMFQRGSGAVEMQVRYINQSVGYIGKWMPVNTVQELTDRVES